MPIDGKKYTYITYDKDNIKTFEEKIRNFNTNSLAAFMDGKNILATTWLCLPEDYQARSKDCESIKPLIDSYLTDLENYTQLSRYYITPELYLEYGKLKDADKYIYKNNLKKKDIRSDIILNIYQYFILFVSCLSNKNIKNISSEFCKVCKRLYRKEFMEKHYNTNEHINNLTAETVGEY